MAFAVIDFETTGVIPALNHRVVEVGIVLATDNGQIEDEWTTLINPCRDIGATQLHGLCAKDLLDAPEFGDIADQILRFVDGRTVVAHNASFDMGFLKAELTRAGYVLSDTPPALCTMKWAGRLVGSAKLAHVCEAFDVELTHAHAALNDARATACVLAHLANMAGHEKEWQEDVARSQRYEWPALQGRAQTQPIPRGEQKPNARSWLDSVLGNTAIPGVPEDEASYLLVLEKVLLDRAISVSEGRQLVAAAKEAGLRGETVQRLHRSHLQSVAQEALADDVVTDDERKDLLIIADLLGLTSVDVDEALARAESEDAERECGHSFSLVKGDRVVFTGELSKPRETWVAEIVQAGLTSGGITKSTKLVVAADPDSLSGKAAKARKYGIAIVDEKPFTRLLAEYCKSL